MLGWHCILFISFFFFFNDTATTEIYTLSLHDALPISPKARAYCPLLHAPINRAWTADTNPAVRQVLESAGDSTAAMRIVIQPNGEIGGIVLYKSSGNDAYDRAVESVLRELQRVPPLPDEMKGESFVAVTSLTYTKQQECVGARGTPLSTLHGAPARRTSGVGAVGACPVWRV